MKDVTPELRLAEIESLIPPCRKNNGHYVWVITFGVIGTVIALYLFNQKKKNKEFEKK